jgi:hypothetical protein
MASKPGFLYKFPWEDWGNGKYLLYAPFVATVLMGWDDADNWAFHIMAVAALRYLNAQLWQMASRIFVVSEKTRIQAKLLEFKQVDREQDWDDFILLQTLVMTLVHWYLPGYHTIPFFNATGMWHMLWFHVGPTEFIYYWFHRGLHHHSLYSAYHSHHHASFLTEPITGARAALFARYYLVHSCTHIPYVEIHPNAGRVAELWKFSWCPSAPPGSCHPFLEHVGYTANFAIPMLGAWWMGTNSQVLIYTYLLGFDFLNAWGHCNFEIVPYG